MANEGGGDAETGEDRENDKMDVRSDTDGYIADARARRYGSVWKLKMLRM